MEKSYRLTKFLPKIPINLTDEAGSQHRDNRTLLDLTDSLLLFQPLNSILLRDFPVLRVVHRIILQGGFEFVKE